MFENQLINWSLTNVVKGSGEQTPNILLVTAVCGVCPPHARSTILSKTIEFKHAHNNTKISIFRE